MQKGYIDVKCPLVNCRTENKEGQNLETEQECKLTKKFLSFHKVKKSKLVYKLFGNSFLKRAKKASNRIKK